MDEALESITAKVAIRATKAVLWHAATDAEELKRWFVRDARIDLREGGAYEFHWGKRNPGSGEFPVVMRGSCISVVPETTLKLTWNSPRWLLTFQLEDLGHETLLTVTAEGFVRGGGG